MPDEPNLLENLKTDENGLIAAIVQDAENGQVLMIAWMDKEALRRTLEGGKACFYSRSRQKYWVKGETSGHFQIVKEVRADCDLDAVLLKVEQVGAACHAGYRSCFYREVSGDGGLEVRDERLVNPEDVY